MDCRKLAKSIMIYMDQNEKDRGFVANSITKLWKVGIVPYAVLTGFSSKNQKQEPAYKLYIFLKNELHCYIFLKDSYTCIKRIITPINEENKLEDVLVTIRCVSGWDVVAHVSNNDCWNCNLFFSETVEKDLEKIVYRILDQIGMESM